MSNVSPLAGLTASNLVIVAGKGGVGKTTVTAVVARAAADAGERVLVVELDAELRGECGPASAFADGVEDVLLGRFLAPEHAREDVDRCMRAPSRAQPWLPRLLSRHFLGAMPAHFLNTREKYSASV